MKKGLRLLSFVSLFMSVACAEPNSVNSNSQISSNSSILGTWKAVSVVCAGGNNNSYYGGSINPLDRSSLVYAISQAGVKITYARGTVSETYNYSVSEFSNNSFKMILSQDGTCTPAGSCTISFPKSSDPNGIAAVNAVNYTINNSGSLVLNIQGDPLCDNANSSYVFQK